MKKYIIIALISLFNVSAFAEVYNCTIELKYVAHHPLYSESINNSEFKKTLVKSITSEPDENGIISSAISLDAEKYRYQLALLKTESSDQIEVSIIDNVEKVTAKAKGSTEVSVELSDNIEEKSVIGTCSKFRVINNKKLDFVK